MAPYIFIGVSALVGLIIWGIKGLILGIIIGWIVSIIIGLALFPLMRILNLGLIKKEYRLAVAEDFYSKNKEHILDLRRFKGMKEKEIIEMFSKYESVE